MTEKYTVTIHHIEVAPTSGIQVGIGQREPHVPFVIYTTNSDAKIATAKANKQLTELGVQLPYAIPEGNYTTVNQLVEKGVFPYRTDAQSHIQQVQNQFPELAAEVINTDTHHANLLSARFTLELFKHKFPSQAPRKHST